MVLLRKFFSSPKCLCLEKALGSLIRIDRIKWVNKDVIVDKMILQSLIEGEKSR